MSCHVDGFFHVYPRQYVQHILAKYSLIISHRPVNVTYNFQVVLYIKYTYRFDAL